MDQPIFAKFIWLGIFGEIEHFRYIKIQLQAAKPRGHKQRKLNEHVLFISFDGLLYASL